MVSNRLMGCGCRRVGMPRRETSLRSLVYLERNIMKKLTFAAFAASALLVSGGAMAKGPTEAGVIANQNACFGIGRADYMSNNDDGGEIISDRAQSAASDPNYANLNVELNHLYRMACQALEAE